MTHLFAKRIRNLNATACGVEDKSFSGMTPIISMVTCPKCKRSKAYRDKLHPEWLGGEKPQAAARP